MMLSNINTYNYKFFTALYKSAAKSLKKLKA